MALRTFVAQVIPASSAVAGGAVGARAAVLVRSLADPVAPAEGKNRQADEGGGETESRVQHRCAPGLGITTSEQPLNPRAHETGQAIPSCLKTERPPRSYFPSPCALLLFFYSGRWKNVNDPAALQRTSDAPTGRMQTRAGMWISLWGIVADEVNGVVPCVSPHVHLRTHVHGAAHSVGGCPHQL